MDDNGVEIVGALNAVTAVLVQVAQTLDQINVRLDEIATAIAMKG